MARRFSVPAPATDVAEVGYLLAREAGARVESLFLRSLADGDITPVALSSAGYVRMADPVTVYGLTDLATLDRRHLTVVRPKHAGALTLLP